MNIVIQFCLLVSQRNLASLTCKPLTIMVQTKQGLHMQEVPLHSLTNRKPQQLTVLEGDSSSQKNDGVNFTDSGGGISVTLQNSIRNICWRTSNDKLELFEYSFDLDLYAASYVIIFEGSKVLPWVHLAYVRNKLYVACCTLHALHYIVLETPDGGRSTSGLGTPLPSLLLNLKYFDFEDDTRNCYFEESNVQGDMIAWTANTVGPELSEEDIYLSAAILTSQGNMNLLRMTNHNVSLSCVNRASRISRALAGINPWGDVGGPETIADFKVVVSDGEAFVVGICKDNKLRIWSFESQDMVFSHDLTSQLLHCDDESGIGDYRIRFCSKTQVIAVLVNVCDLALFLQFRVEFQLPGRVAMFEQISATSSTTIRDEVCCHLIDFAFSFNTITAVWQDAEENDYISICEADSGIWHDVVMHPLPSQEVPLLPQKDIRESYIDHIFAPCGFSTSAILRALSLGQRATTVSLLSELKDRVAAHIQNAINGMMPEHGANDDALQVSAWSNLYQKLVQYQQVLTRTVGITTIQGYDQSNLTVIKKGCVYVLTPTSTLESVRDGCDPSALREAHSLDQCSDSNLADLKNLLTSLENLRRYLGDEFLESLLHNIRLSDRSPYDIILEVTPEIISAGINEPGDLFENFVDLKSSFGLLLDCLEPVDCGNDMDIPDTRSWPAGSQGTEIIAYCVIRHLANRLELSTLLLIAMVIFRKLQDEKNPLEEDSNLISRAKGYVDVYKSLYEISSTMSQSISQGSLDTKLQRLSLLESHISNFSPGRARARVSATGSDKTIVEYFLSGEGGKLTKGLLLSRGCKGELLQNDMIKASIKILVYLLWPCGPTLALPDFMLTHCQFAALQKYLQKSARWCSWCPKSKQYMLAYCHLQSGNYSKAVRSFISASSGIVEEEYMSSKLLSDDEDELPPVAKEIVYYTKVLPIFEKLDLPEQVITLAQQAIECTRMHDYNANLPVLWSSIFRQSNLLGRHNMSLKAIVLNPDHHHKKDCLRTFAMSLCERREFKTLVELQYGDLEDELVDILQHRSRGTDITVPEHQYYDLLYAFHVQRGNFKKAASAMYEQSYRIGQRLSKSERISTHLREILNCLAACINCLYLVDENNRWILHPLGNYMSAESSQYQQTMSQSDTELSARKRSKIIIHELEDVKKEFKLVEMKVKLVEFSDEFPPSSLQSTVSAKEISSFLCHVGLYDDAVSLSTTFGISIVHIFESLTSKAIRLSFVNDKSATECWEWLQQNDTVKTRCFGGQSSYGNWTSADVAYRLLQVYLESYGHASNQGTTYFQATAKVLLSFNAALPAWFVSAYKLVNFPELLRLLVCYDRLDEATLMAVEMIELARAKLPTQFDTDPSKRQAICLPITIIEHLLCILHSSTDGSELYDMLHTALNDYLSHVQSVSDSMVESSMRRVEAVVV